MLSVGIICLYFAFTLQIIVVIERILYYTIALCIGGDKSDAQMLAQRGFLEAVVGAITESISVGIAVFISLTQVVLQNVILLLALVLFGAALFTIAGNGTDLFALFVNVYNSGIGVLLDTLIVKPFQVVYLILNPFIVIGNGLAWIWSQMLTRVVFPVFQLNANALPELIQGLTATGAASVLSLNTFSQRILECSVISAARAEDEHSVPFSNPNMHCVANTEYLILDLMTPAAFLKQSAGATLAILTGSCSALKPVLEVAWYPTLDYNFYFSIHNFVNAVLKLILMPLSTWQRCEFAKAGSFTELEVTVMCLPDWAHTEQMFTQSALSLGRLIDNWLDIILHVSETHVQMSNTAICSQIAPIESIRYNITNILADNPDQVKVIGLENMLGFTDGLHSSFWDGQNVMYAIEQWPIQINTDHGVAAIRYVDQETADGMLGCSCSDTSSGMQLTCASIPLEASEMNRTIHDISFDSSDMTCDTTLIKVQSLRFSRARYSIATSNGVDRIQNPEIEEWRDTVADAMIYIQPLCTASGRNQESCLRDAQNCYPYCMGLHKAGGLNHKIELMNARVWRETVVLQDSECSMARLDCENTELENNLQLAARAMTVIGIDMNGENFHKKSSCIFDGKLCREELSVVTSRESPSVGRNIYSAPVISLDDQPIVVAGDVMLYHNSVSKEIIVSRLRNSGTGLRQEQVTTMENKFTFSYEFCAVDESCEIVDNTVMFPSTFAIVNQKRATAVSQWAIHYAVDMETSVLNGLFASCNDAGGLSAISSIMSPRVWTFKTTRSVYAMGTNIPASDDGGLYFMTIPESLNQYTSCDSVVNFHIESLEYIDDSNILITTTAGTPRTYPQDKTYRYYYMHPNRHDCLGEAGNSEAVFTCFRSEENGPFRDDTGQAPILAGELCPSLQRMPKLGSAGAYAFAATVDIIRLTLQGITVLPAIAVAQQNIGELFSVRSEFTYHTILDTSGYRLFDLENVIYNIDKALMYMWQSVGMIANLFKDKPGERFFQSVLIGTAKVKQYAYDESTLFNDPVLQKLKQITDTKTGPHLDKVQSLLLTPPIGSLPGPIKAMQRMGQRTFSSMKFNARLLRKWLTFIMKTRGQYDLISNSIDDAMDIAGKLADDVREISSASLVAPMYYQCDGLATILGYKNPFAKSFREACLLTPNAIEGTLEILSVLFSAYPTVACSCKLLELDINANAMCRQRIRSLQAEAWTVGVQGVIDVSDNKYLDERAVCHHAMDIANARLEQAMDPLFNRLSKLIETIPGVLDYMLVFIKEDAGECLNSQNAFTVTIMPEPVDYFMRCSSTFDCRSRCLDNFQAFEVARAQIGVEKLHIDRQINVKSKFFDTQAIDNMQHLPPYDIRGILQTPESCIIHQQDREHTGKTVVIVGKNDSSALKTRYCIPSDVSNFVTKISEHEVLNFNFTVMGGLIEGMYIAHADGPVFILSVLNGVFEFPVTKLSVLFGTLNYELLRTSQWDSEVYNPISQPGDRDFMIQEIQHVYVKPGDRVYVIALQMQTSSTQLDGFDMFESRQICIEIYTNVNPLDNHYTFCEVDELPSKEYALVSIKHDSYSLRNDDEIWLPRQRSLPIVRITNQIRSDVSTSKTLYKTIGLQKNRPLYLTTMGTAVENTRHVSILGYTQGDKLQVFLSGIHGETWVQLLEIYLTTGIAYKESAELVTKTIGIDIPCTVETCMGCQTTPASTEDNYISLQSKCQAAQQCALAKCVGTPVNLRSPLCNIGAVLSSRLDMYKVGMIGLYQALSASIIMVVELSEQRREIYSVKWPEDAFVSSVCASKDVVVEISAGFTSIIGSTIVDFQNTANALTDSEVFVIDSRWNAQFFMGLHAITKLISSILMVPVYSAMALQRCLTCLTNDLFMTLDNVSGGFVRLDFGGVHDKGVCLSENVGERMRELNVREDLDEVSSIVTEIQDIVRMQPYDKISHILDSGFAYLIGIVDGIMDVAQTIDFQKCKLPDITLDSIHQCVCGDLAMQIPIDKRQGSDLWCRGPLLLIDAMGNDFMIWNPYSYEELMSNSDEIDSYIECLSSTDVCTEGDTSSRCNEGCDSIRPRPSELEKQNVNLMQVITRCRGNYQSKQWDPASSNLGVYSWDEWTELFSGMVVEDKQDYYTEVRLKLLNLKQYANGMVGQQNQIICLNENLGSGISAQSCSETTGEQNDWIYIKNLEDSLENKYTEVDACKTFSGSIPAQGIYDLQLPNYVWSGSSQNSEPVASFHNTREIQNTESELDILISEIQKDIRDAQIPETIAGNVEIQSFTSSSDVFHQMIDCVIMGPYASANLHVNASAYNRGQPDSRDFGIGSRVRIDLVKKIKEKLNVGLAPAVTDQANLFKNRIISLWSDKNFLKCKCTTGESSLECCKTYTAYSDIDFEARESLSGVNLHDDIYRNLLTNMIDIDLLKRDIWIDDSLKPPDKTFTEEERITRRNSGIFDKSSRVVSYGLDEVSSSVTYNSLWHHCADLLDSAFFTIPIINSDTEASLPLDLVQAIKNFNPALETSDSWLHAQEAIIDIILQRAREDVPVFWTHNYRYMPSDSVWCENDVDPDCTKQDIAVKRSASTLGGVSLTGRQFSFPTLHETQFPGKLDRCWCDITSLFVTPVVKAPRCQYPGYEKLQVKGNPSILYSNEDGTDETSYTQLFLSSSKFTLDELISDCNDDILCKWVFYKQQTVGQKTQYYQWRGNYEILAGDLSSDVTTYEKPNNFWIGKKFPTTYHNYYVHSDSKTPSLFVKAGFLSTEWEKPTRLTTNSETGGQQDRTCADEFKCKIPVNLDPGCTGDNLPVELQQRWNTLCTQGDYNSKSELYTLLEVIEKMNYDDARCKEPSTSWGLLSEDNWYNWFKAETDTSTWDVDLHSMATHGPSGTRLAMLDTDFDIKNERLLEHDPGNSSFNFKYKHSIAQPFCNANKASLLDATTDLKNHFKDVFFPTAHSVHISPVNAYCTSWAVEYAILSEIKASGLSEGNTRYIEQVNREKTWKERCNLKLADIGICMLRGVYELEPPNEIQFDFSSTCGTLPDWSGLCDTQWFFPNCIMACKLGVIISFHDLKHCTLSDSVDGCNVNSLLSFDPRSISNYDNVKLNSMTWPLKLPIGEHNTQAESKLKKINGVSRPVDFTSLSIWDSIISNLIAEMSLQDENTDPRGHCDDMLDYWPGDAQHPVGYHPTTTCDKTKTQMRGFANWMSRDDLGHYLWKVDNRMRNSTLDSQYFGSGHLSCDSSNYGKIMREPRGWYMESEWDANTKFDVYGLFQATTASFNTKGFNEEQEGTALVNEDDSEDFLLHQAGLIRNWYRGIATGVWPHWYQGESFGEFGSHDDSTCSEHPLYECDPHVASSCGGFSGVVCLHTDDEKTIGICAGENTCFRHDHCSATNEMCNAMGKCVKANIRIVNEMKRTVYAQFFSGDETNSISSKGFSEYQYIQNFTIANGQCSLINWNEYYKIWSKETAHYNCNELQSICPPGPLMNVKKVDIPHSLHQTPHHCDKDWQHTTHGIIGPRSNTYSGGVDFEISSAFVLPSDEIRFFTQTKTYVDDETESLCYFNSNDAENELGLITPYAYYDEQGVRSMSNEFLESTIDRCSQFDICPTLDFYVDGNRLSDRYVAEIIRDFGKPSLETNSFRVHSSRDKQQCSASGYLTREGSCIIDPITNPLIMVLTEVAKNEIFDWPLYNQEKDDIQITSNLLTYCPDADTTAITDVIYNLLHEYIPDKKSEQLKRSNSLLFHLFGIELTNSEYLPYRADFTELEYEKNTKCMKWIITELGEVQNSLPLIYTIDPRFEAVRPGSSLYLYTGNAHIEFPLIWFWKCVVLHSGTKPDFMAKLNGDVQIDFDEITCELPNTITDDVITSRDLLIKSDYLFDSSPTITTMADSFKKDVDFILQQGLDELGISEFAQTECLYKLEDQPIHCNDVFPIEYVPKTCWIKECNDCNDVLDDDVIDNSDLSLRNQAVKEIFGVSSLVELSTHNIEYFLQTLGTIERRNLDTTMISHDSNFVPLYDFNFVNNPVNVMNVDLELFFQDSNNVLLLGEDNTASTSYATLDSSGVCTSKSGYTAYVIQNKEHNVWKSTQIQSKFITREKALYELLKYFKFNIANTASFSSNNLRQNANFLLNYNYDFSISQMHLDISNALEFSNILNQVNFICKDSNEINFNRETNTLHADLRQCKNSLKYNTGWELPSDSTLTLKDLQYSILNNGIYPGFIQKESLTRDLHDSRGYLDQITSDDVIRKGANHFCFKEDSDRVEIINPLWSGSFDLDSKCEVEKVGEIYRIKDTLEMNSKQPPHCIDKKHDLISYSGSGTLQSQYVPLCQRKPTKSSQCDRISGTLNGLIGDVVEDLLSSKPIVKEKNLYSNNIFRRNIFTPTINGDVRSIHIQNHEISGNDIQFAISERGQIYTKCLILHERCVDWLQNIEDVWKYEHKTRIKPATIDVSTTSQSWKCPLKLASFWSGTMNNLDSKPMHPSISRNFKRFSKTTGDNFNVHPTVSSYNSIQNIRPARFMSDVEACMGLSTDECNGDLVKAINFVKAVLSDVSFIIPNTRTKCQDILDWPEMGGSLRDQSVFEPQNTNICFVQDRLPNFKMGLTRRKVQSEKRLSSVSEQGICRMKRLHNLAVHAERPDPPGIVNRIEDCRKKDGNIECRYESIDSTSTPPTITAKMHKFDSIIDAASKTIADDLRTKKFTHGDFKLSSVIASGYVLKDSQENTLLKSGEDTDHYMLSHGIPFQMKSERLIAKEIRRAICYDSASSQFSACERVRDGSNTESIDDALWNLGAFTSELKAKAIERNEFQTSDSVYNTDADLWSRNWVYCEKGEICRGSINKNDWIQPALRNQRCHDEMISIIDNDALVDSSIFGNSRLDFCNLDEHTKKLCSLVQKWKSKVLSILCRESNLDLCPNSGFFYSPTLYSISNREFVRNTITSFYSQINPTLTCLLKDTSNDQVASNEALKQRCASQQIVPIKNALQQMREIKTIIIELLYYFMQIQTQLLRMLSAIIISVPNGVSNVIQTASTRMLVYINAFFATLGQVALEIAKAFFEIIFREGLPREIVNIIQSLCLFVDEVHEHLIGFSPETGFLCPIFNWIGVALEDLGKTIKDIAELQVLNLQPFLFLETVGNFFDSTGKAIKSALPCSQEERMVCDFEMDEEEDILTGALPAPTRCTATSSFFLGDATPLSCTAADTCRAGLFNNTLVACALCEKTIPSNRFFGCETWTKLCTCDIPDMVQTQCFTNADCQNAATCQYISNSRLEMGQEDCRTCTNSRICFRNSDSTGVCACTLQTARFASCPISQIGTTMVPSENSLCLISRSVQPKFLINFADLITTPCSLLDLNPICRQITDTSGVISGTYAVGTNIIQGYGRRLLTENQINTRDALCLDAFSIPLPEVAKRCIQRCSISADTVKKLELDTPLETFCSFSDFQYAIKIRPMLPILMLGQPSKLKTILIKHTNVGDIFTSFQTWQDMLELYLYKEKQAINMRRPLKMNITFTPNSSNNSLNYSLSFDTANSRRLLQISKSSTDSNFNILDSLNVNFFSKISRLHSSYANKLADAFNYEYPPLTDPLQQKAWSNDWPPQFVTTGSQTTTECLPLKETITIFKEGSTASLKYFTTDPVVPPWSLSFPNITQNNPLNNVVKIKNHKDSFVGAFDWIIWKILELIKIDRWQFSNGMSNVISTTTDFLLCDIESLQTCSGWNARLINGIFVISCLFFIYYAFMLQLNMGFIAIVTIPFFGNILLYYCYSYQILCFPLVPSCFLLDVYETIQIIIPKYIELPPAMFQSEDCHGVYPVDASCLVSCQEEPYNYITWIDPFSWAITELKIESIVFDIFSYIPLFDLNDLKERVQSNQQVIISGDTGFVATNRFCFFYSSYLLFPYMILFICIAFSIFASAKESCRLISPIIAVFSSLLTTIFTK